MTYDDNEHRKTAAVPRTASIVSHAKRRPLAWELLNMVKLPPVDPSFRRATRRGLFMIAAIFAFNAAIAGADGRWLLALILGGFVLVVVSLRTYTSPERWPDAERWLRETFGRGDKP